MVRAPGYTSTGKYLKMFEHITMTVENASKVPKSAVSFLGYQWICGLASPSVIAN